MNISIKDVCPEDIHKIAEIERLCFTTPWSEEAFASQLTSNPVFKALIVDGEIAGYAIIDTQILPESELFNIAVAPEYRGKGLSKMLMDSVLEDARKRGAETVLLEVRASNAAAIGLYEKYGFVQNGVRKGYYSCPKEDAILMCRKCEF
jgi:ribosomal-protein-alanine N-acetyltransferase